MALLLCFVFQQCFLSMLAETIVQKLKKKECEFMVSHFICKFNSSFNRNAMQFCATLLVLCTMLTTRFVSICLKNLVFDNGIIMLGRFGLIKGFIFAPIFGSNLCKYLVLNSKRSNYFLI